MRAVVCWRLDRRFRRKRIIRIEGIKSMHHSPSVATATQDVRPKPHSWPPRCVRKCPAAVQVARPGTHVSIVEAARLNHGTYLSIELTSVDAGPDARRVRVFASRHGGEQHLGHRIPVVKEVQCDRRKRPRRSIYMQAPE